MNRTDYKILIFKKEDGNYYDETNNIEKYIDKGDKIEIHFKSGHKYNYWRKNIIFKKSTNLFPVFKYLIKIIDKKNEINGKQDKVDLIKKLYHDYFEDSYISTNLALYVYLNPKEIKKYNITDTLIFPFSTNKSQFEAVKKAFSSQLSIIEGPPGTGKTQTILNIIANIIMQNKTVAVVSNNNAATNNIYNKLQKYNYDFFCARLGKNENKDKFIQEQNGNYGAWKYNDATIIINQETKIELNNLYNKAFELFDKERELANYYQSMRALNVEYEHFKNKDRRKKVGNDNLFFDIENIKTNINCKNILYDKTIIDILNKIPLHTKLKFLIKYNIGSIRNYFGKNKLDLEFIVDRLGEIYYKQRRKELLDNIEKLKADIEILNQLNLLNSIITISMHIFNDKLNSKYNINQKRNKYFIEDFKKSDNIKFFLEDYPVVLSSTHSIKNTLNLGNQLFDYVIIDESSQVDLSTGLLALSVAKNAVIVGDSKQIPYIIKDDKNNSLHKYVEELNCEYFINDRFDYLKNSILDSCIKTVDANYKTLLREHYRCHPKIIDFCNKKFYNNELIIMSKNNDEKDVLSARVTNKGYFASRFNINEREIDIVIKEYLEPFHETISSPDVAIISPYRNHIEEVKNQTKSSKTNNKDIVADTVHAFQGQERNIVILSTVANKINDFVNDPKLLNVAISRAVKHLCVVTSHQIANTDNNISDLLDYISYTNCSVSSTNIKSIFDIMRQDTDDIIEEYLDKYRNKYGFINKMFSSKVYKKINKAEEIGYYNIKDIIHKEFSELTLSLFVPLKEIININVNIVEPLTEQEIYFINTDSHIDILIYNRITKKPVLAIEIDGDEHRNSSIQEARDLKKDNILRKYNIALLRLSTRKYNEIEQIRDAIKRAQISPQDEYNILKEQMEAIQDILEQEYSPEEIVYQIKNILNFNNNN
ncbi:AAA domain-containing protein [uncultured Brachyspira sp.]|uniref:AAA domain-containing protein n=1 Tax=uncultured Brachyspira sp. TaxID=221953 RepID=UPI0026118C68|nr:AAA domain-containing protein [uncultured Brachyspira sp.]